MMHDKPDSDDDDAQPAPVMPVNRMPRGIIHGTVSAILAVSLGMPFAAWSQVNNPAYADYLLVGQFGEICTMCEAILLCEVSDTDTPRVEIPKDGSFTVYHMQTRTFWSQIATIWEWFVTNFDSDSLAQTGHTRPVRVYTVTDGHWSEPLTVEAHLSLDPATINVGDETIDRIADRWLRGTPQQAVGFCQRLPLWNSLEIIASHFLSDND